MALLWSCGLPLVGRAPVEEWIGGRVEAMPGNARVGEDGVDPQPRACDRRDAMRAPVAAEERERPRLAGHRPDARALPFEQGADAVVVAVVLAAKHGDELEGAS